MAGVQTGVPVLPGGGVVTQQSQEQVGHHPHVTALIMRTGKHARQACQQVCLQASPLALLGPRGIPVGFPGLPHSSARTEQMYKRVLVPPHALLGPSRHANRHGQATTWPSGDQEGV